MEKLSLSALTLAALTWSTVARAVVIDFAESGGTANAVESVELTTTTPTVTGLPGCGVPPCVSAIVNGGSGLRDGQEGPAQVELALPLGPGSFTTITPAGQPTTVLGYLMDRDEKTVSDIVKLTITNLANVQTVNITFTSDSPTSNFFSIPGGFAFNKAIEGKPTTVDHVDLSDQFFTGPPEGPASDQKPYALPSGYMITAFSDVDIPEPSSLIVFGCSLIGLVLAASASRCRRAVGLPTPVDPAVFAHRA